MTSKARWIVCAVFAWMGFACASASASIHTWTGPAGGLWSNAANWTGGVPTSGESTPTGTVVAFGSNTSSVMDIAGLIVDEVHFTGNNNTIGGSTTLSLSGSVQQNNILNDGTGNVLAGTLPLALAGSTSIFVSSTSAQLSIDGSISGANAGLRVIGSGAAGVTLRGLNTYTKATTVATGTLRLDSGGVDRAIVGSALNVGVGGGAGATVVLDQSAEIASTTDVVVYSDGTLNVNSFGETIGALQVIDGTVTLGSGSLGLGGALSMSGGAISGTGPLSLGGDVTLASTATETATISTPITLNAARTLTLADGPQVTDATLSGVISNGAGTGALAKDGPGRLLLSTATNSTYTGGTMVRNGQVVLNGNAAAVIPNAGTLTIGDGNGAAASASVVLGQGNEIGTAAPVEIAGDGLLDLAGFSDSVASLNATGGAISSTGGTLYSTGALTLTDATATLGTAGGITASGLMTLTGATVAGSGTAALTPTGGVQAASSATGASVVSAAVALTGTRVFTVSSGGAAPELTLSGPTSGGGGAIDKQGAGTLRLTGAGSHALTAVNGGTLVADGTLSGPVSVGDGARLTGSGTVGIVTVAGTLRPGAPQLTTGALAFSATGRLEDDVASAMPPRVVANGTVTIDPAATLALSPAAGLTTLAAGTALPLIDNDGADAITGTFAGAPFALGGLPLTPNYAGGTGNDLALVAGNGAPVPGAATASPSTAQAGTPIAFSVAPTDPNGDALTVTWDFGDGTTGSGAIAAHVYNQGGTFTAKATVSDGALTATASVAVTITTASPPNGIKGPPPICADRTAPVTTLSKPSITAKGLTVKGRVSDAAGASCGGIARVDVAVARKAGKKCLWIGTSKPSSCAAVPAKALKRVSGAVSPSFTYTLKKALKPGSYVVAAIARDTTGNVETVVVKRTKTVTLKAKRR